MFQNLLLSYRREVGHWKGKIDEHPPVPEGFLTDAERTRGAAPLSFDVVLEAYRHEYQRRFDEHVRAGGPVLSVEAPPFIQRVAMVVEPERIDPAVHGIAVARPTTASASISAHPAYLANRGSKRARVIVVDQNTGFDATHGVDTHDGMHPNDAGGQKMAEKFYQAIKEYWKTLPVPRG